MRLHNHKKGLPVKGKFSCFSCVSWTTKTPAIHPCSSVAKNTPHPCSSVPLHSRFQGVFTPHPRPLSPARGEGCHALTQPQKRPSRQRQVFVLFVCFVDNQKPSGSSVKIRVHPWQKKHPASVLFRGSAKPASRGFSPRQPHPCRSATSRGKKYRGNATSCSLNSRVSLRETCASLMPHLSRSERRLWPLPW